MTFDYRPKVDQHNGLLNHRGIPTFLNDVKFQMRIFFWKSRCHHHHYDGWPVYIIQSKTETIDYYKYSENYKIKTLKGFLKNQRKMNLQNLSDNITNYQTGFSRHINPYQQLVGDLLQSVKSWIMMLKLTLYFMHFRFNISIKIFRI